MNSTKARARFAGVLYLLMGLTGAFNLLYIPAAFFVPGDATATARRITDAALTYRIVVLSGLLSSIIFSPAGTQPMHVKLAAFGLPFEALGELSLVVWLLVWGAKVQPVEAQPSHLS